MPTQCQNKIIYEEIIGLLNDYSRLLKEGIVNKDALICIQDEPTIHPEIIEILRYARTLNIKFTPLLSGALS
jgi:hypothetical protein